MGLPGDVEIKLVIRNREIVDVLPFNGEYVTALTPEDHREIKQSPYGLRPVDTIYETQVAQSVAPKCYIIIGGYKVQVPCG
jgi:hypothetical protein